jgi:hypothetical protein
MLSKPKRLPSDILNQSVQPGTSVAVVLQDISGQYILGVPNNTDCCRAVVHYVVSRDKDMPSVSGLTGAERRFWTSVKTIFDLKAFPESWWKGYDLNLVRLNQVKCTITQSMLQVSFGSAPKPRVLKETSELVKKGDEPYREEFIWEVLIRLLDEELSKRGIPSLWSIKVNPNGDVFYTMVRNAYVFSLRSVESLGHETKVNTPEVQKLVRESHLACATGITRFSEMVLEQDRGLPVGLYKPLSDVLAQHVENVSVKGCATIKLPSGMTVITQGESASVTVEVRTQSPHGKSQRASSSSSRDTPPVKRQKVDGVSSSSSSASSSSSSSSSSLDTPPVKRQKVDGVSSSSSSASSSSSSSSSSTSSSPDTPPVKRQKVDKGPSASSSSSSSSSPSTTSPKKREREEPPLCLDPSCPDRNPSVADKHQRLGTEWRVSSNGRRLYHNTERWVAEFDKGKHWVYGREENSGEELKRHW